MKYNTAALLITTGMQVDSTEKAGAVAIVGSSNKLSGAEALFEHISK